MGILANTGGFYNHFYSALAFMLCSQCRDYYSPAILEDRKENFGLIFACRYVYDIMR